MLSSYVALPILSCWCCPIHIFYWCVLLMLSCRCCYITMEHQQEISIKNIDMTALKGSINRIASTWHSNRNHQQNNINRVTPTGYHREDNIDGQHQNEISTGRVDIATRTGQHQQGNINRVTSTGHITGQTIIIYNFNQQAGTQGSKTGPIDEITLTGNIDRSRRTGT